MGEALRMHPQYELPKEDSKRLGFDRFMKLYS
jgi:hypothetical protein